MGAAARFPADTQGMVRKYCRGASEQPCRDAACRVSALDEDTADAYLRAIPGRRGTPRARPVSTHDLFRRTGGHFLDHGQDQLAVTIVQADGVAADLT